jgi:hypothetical protein
VKNHIAVKINEALGVNLYDELNLKVIKLNKFTKKERKALFIDDLVTEKNEPTLRLIKLYKEIVWGL